MHFVNVSRATHPLSRRSFLRLGALTLGTYALSSLRHTAPIMAAAEQQFLTGANYPWIAYGHDFGKNAWGHGGIITSGWTCQTYPDSQGFIDTRRCTEKAHTGNASLCITADLAGGHPNRSQGEVYLDLNNHAPIGVPVPVNMSNVTAHCWLWLPSGSAGPSNARNGIQLFFKSEEAGSDAWYSFYSPWQNIEPSWEERWVRFTANPSGPAGYVDPRFDPTKIIAIGVKVAIDSSSNATLAGTIYLDDFELSTNSPILFDFEVLEAETDFDALKCSCAALRVFVLADGRAAPEFTPTGQVSTPGFDEYFFQDFDALLEIARRRNLLLMPVLLDFGWCDSPRQVSGAQLGGHSDIIRDASKRQTFLEEALKPLIRRYAGNSQILAWDVINEPEWAIADIPQAVQVGDPVTLQQMRDFVAACADVIHTYSSQQVTVGSARRRWLQYWVGLGLDLYQFHWYDHFAAEEPFPWPPYAELGLDKPCIIGEVPTANTAYSVEDYLDAARAGGYHGLLAWSYRAEDEYSDFSRARLYLDSRCSYLPLTSR
jgi:hypothetical protein